MNFHFSKVALMFKKVGDPWSTVYENIDANASNIYSITGHMPKNI